MSNRQDKARPSEQAVEQELYAKHQKIYPREVHGIFATLRIIGVLVLLGLYYLLPWFSWDGHQAVLFDLPARKFYIFDLTFWPQDFFYLAALLIIAGLSLFFFTALAGRLWCGYACPQTVWTELFLWIERKIEGDRPKQMKLAKSPWNTNKLVRRGSKQIVWILLSLWTGFTFVGYFTPITELWQSMLQFDLGPWETFWVFFYGFATYGNAGFMREQVCIYMCPYARFQSAMFDKNTLVISYDPNRGEPRGARKRGTDKEAKGLGDCIDCTLCVQACPTGIDIRDGLQYQCIGCAACIDACNEVMDKMNYPRGLIRYTTENALEGKPSRVLRPRIFVYGLLLLLITAAVFYSIATRVPLELNVMRDRNTLYRETNQGLVENIYTLKILNMDDTAHTYRLTIDGPPQMELQMARDVLRVERGGVMEFPVQLRIDPVHLEKTGYDIQFHLEAVDEPELTVTQTGRFIGPAMR
ncbi:cytochrome c oxidase accessory protein CcoG [Thiohalophilus thiocyanatoxydans]|uniref:Cytochrome c oxidase accessory protein FixG n=1 Tax=Thiohalophilus thiocyanatoxydans TaxID=381308 RepID=A0A4R8J254_9GAMM|nr:cytochrome c oxidase accessory protein CcoG [Thiohalophilus thiocyanatoxydans]TDY03943.1 cytochrome c oxidase accessory protein FixG [Thiohalophilus thiocyanatoxydans]